MNTRGCSPEGAASISDGGNTQQTTSRPVRHILRGIGRSDRYFWAANHAQQWALAVTDKSMDGTQRPLPKNELVAMGLNEIAAKAGRGYFFHLRNKEFWKKAPNANLCPAEKQSPQPGQVFYREYMTAS
jgi:hypothetical protein